MLNSLESKKDRFVNKIENFVWIVIPTWNRCKDLLECLDSLNKVTYSPFKILVVDNASEDNSAGIVEDRYPHVSVIRLNENLGAPAASNIGFKYALNNGADYVLRLDSDTVVSPDFLTPLVFVGEKNPQIGVVSPKIYYYNPPDLIWYAGVGANSWHFGAIDKMQNKKDSEVSSPSCLVDYVWGAAMLIKRDVLEKTQGFDTDFFIYYEEVDFCKRVQELGYQLYYTAESKIWHKVGIQNPTAWSAYHWNLSKMILFRKHARNIFHRFSLILYAFAYAWGDALLNLVQVRKYSRNRGPLKDTLKGLWDGLHRELTCHGNLE